MTGWPEGCCNCCSRGDALGLAPGAPGCSWWVVVGVVGTEDEAAADDVEAMGGLASMVAKVISCVESGVVGGATPLAAEPGREEPG